MIDLGVPGVLIRWCGRLESDVSDGGGGRGGGGANDVMDVGW